MRFFYFMYDGFDVFFSDEGSDDVVNQYDFDIHSGFAKPLIDTILASFASGDNFFYLTGIQGILPLFTKGYDLCRTDNNAKKQMGISFIVFDMKSKGVTVRPIETIDGGRSSIQAVPIPTTFWKATKGASTAR